jgi:hypothetical protein
MEIVIPNDYEILQKYENGQINDIKEIGEIKFSRPIKLEQLLKNITDNTTFFALYKMVRAIEFLTMQSLKILWGIDENSKLCPVFDDNFVRLLGAVMALNKESLIQCINKPRIISFRSHNEGYIIYPFMQTEREKGWTFDFEIISKEQALEILKNHQNLLGLPD